MCNVWEQKAGINKEDKKTTKNNLFFFSMRHAKVMGVRKGEEERGRKGSSSPLHTRSEEKKRGGETFA